MSSSPSSAPSFSLSLSLRARVLSARSLLAFSMRRAPLFRSFSFQASSSSSFSVFYDGTFVAFFLLRVCPCTTRRGSLFQVFLLSPKDSHKFIPLSPSLCREKKKDKKGQQRQTQRRRRSLFLLLWVKQKKGRKNKKEKRIELPPQARLYISKSPILSAQIIITVGRGRKDAETTTVLGGSRLFRGIQSSETLKGGENERFDGRVVRCARVCERAHWCEENIIEIVV